MMIHHEKTQEKVASEKRVNDKNPSISYQHTAPSEFSYEKIFHVSKRWDSKLRKFNLKNILALLYQQMWIKQWNTLKYYAIFF